MLRKLIGSAVKLRLITWAMAKNAPSGAGLKERVRLLLLGVMGAAAGGVFLSLAVAAGLVILYQNLIAQGVNFVNAQLIIFSIIALLVLVVLYLIRKCLILFSGKLSFDSPASADQPKDILNDVLTGFLDGLITKKS